MNRKEILSNYVSAGHPTFFSSPAFLYKYYDKKIPLNKITKILQSNETYTLFKQRHSKIRKNPVYLYEPRKLLEIDLIEVGNLFRKNKGIKFLFTAVDGYSRKLWVIPLWSKTAPEVLRGFKEVLAQMGKKPQRICSDKEKAVQSRIFQAFCKENNIEIRHPLNLKHCPFIERVNRSLKDLIYRYLSHTKQFKYLDALPLIVKSYNMRRHRVIEMSPEEAEKEKNWPKVSFNLEKNVYMKNVKRKTPQFKEGMRVRRAEERNLFARSYQKYFLDHIFEIDEVSRKFSIPIYYIKDPDDGQRLLAGFYGNELIKVEEDE